MLKQISIDGFKCFDSETIPLNRLTLFAGRNSMGKSTVIQAILAMVQNGENPFMGNYMKLGTISELKNKYVGSKKIKIGLDYELDGTDYHYSKEIEMDDKPINVDGKLENQLTIRYLTADRKGVDAVYPKAIDANDEIGIDCRYAFDFLAKHERDPIQNESMVYDPESSLIFAGQVNYWLDKILGYRIKAEEIEFTDTIRVTYEKGKLKDLRPKNVGTGVTYIAELIIAAFSCKKGDTLIIENPEIHIHPSGQTEFVKFISFLVKNGIQVVMETHSDHIYNGVRKSIYLDWLENNAVSIYFFEQNENETNSPVLIPLDEEGKALVQKEYLFDQIKKDLDVLLGW